MHLPTPQTISSPKRVLIVSLQQPRSVLPLARSLAELGAHVEIAASGKRFAETGQAIAAHHRCRSLLPMSGLRRALRRSRPDLIISADERSASLLEELAAWAQASRNREAHRITRLLAHSFADLDSPGSLRSPLPMPAKVEGIAGAIPPTVPVPLRPSEAYLRVCST